MLGGFINGNESWVGEVSSKGVGWEFNDSALCSFIHIIIYFIASGNTNTIEQWWHYIGLF